MRDPAHTLKGKEMTKQETDLLRAARAMYQAIQSQSYLDVCDIIDDLSMPADEIDTIMKDYDND